MSLILNFFRGCWLAFLGRG